MSALLTVNLTLEIYTKMFPRKTVYWVRSAFIVSCTDENMRYQGSL